MKRRGAGCALALSEDAESGLPPRVLEALADFEDFEAEQKGLT